MRFEQTKMEIGLETVKNKRDFFGSKRQIKKIFRNRAKLRL